MKKAHLLTISLITATALMYAVGTQAVSDSPAGFVDTPLDTKPVKAIDKDSGKGVVVLKNKLTGKELERFTAFSGGGVDARLANVGTSGEQKGVLAMQEQKGKFMKLYTRDGELLATRKVSNKKVHHEYTAGKLVADDDENYIVAARKTGSDDQVLLLVYSYNEDNRTLDRVTSKTVTGLDSTVIDDGFGLIIGKRKLKLNDEKGNNLATLELDGRTLQ
ncbi:MAG: hypothetical protein COW24_03060 [Candidatus Kerfeldbacteria bacterium CG15_BIG_FIL_POST_REV_8_21_14_020_45_12]|uniref:Phytase-like domain-containing protein n=1 Tax=Candidatus Kerfeldbacteria bacterium CG15_BIG_FIL_POST_REV_8_21_14_020_45_12 TaxID=2014247 RepID=A0A2M7H3V4_9BACT|nr:MAG: hypothetical protein COW24_03060 [Candidatus Kerfeldbacteria bacterium CG15_BIG_FIL_POST_REV_8_21_14_020_45_12]PJA93002.1 MAG: hypothetical protein CO132_05140 [Candidatus Kerfeldbacteria bacterium CG_4_9_14_3_um_filter_45_8]